MGGVFEVLVRMAVGVTTTTHFSTYETYPKILGSSAGDNEKIDYYKKLALIV